MWTDTWMIAMNRITTWRLNDPTRWQYWMSVSPGCLGADLSMICAWHSATSKRDYPQKIKTITTNWTTRKPREARGICFFCTRGAIHTYSSSWNDSNLYLLFVIRIVTVSETMSYLSTTKQTSGWRPLSPRLVPKLSWFTESEGPTCFME